MRKIKARLVRDKVVERLQKEGKRVFFHTAEEGEFGERLRQKLQAEVGELLCNPSCKEEVADVMEVLEAMMEYYQMDKKDVQRIKKKKAREKGSFTKRIILEHYE